MKIKQLISYCLILMLLVACDLLALDVDTDEQNVVETLRVQPVGDDIIQVGVLAIRSASAANAQYGGLIAYLEEELGQPVRLVPVTQEEQFQFVENGKLDFTINNPLAGVQIQRLYDTKFLATLSRPNTGTQFSALIIVRVDSDIQTIEDLKGVNGTCVAHQTAAAGCNFQVYHLLQKGINPYEDFVTFTETPSQDNIVLGVQNGTFDVGFIRTGQLEKMLRENTIPTLDNIRILDQAEDDFFFPHTTRLYPEWPFAALADTDPDLVKQVQDALLRLDESHPAMQTANASGFVTGVDYTAVDDLIVELELRSWDTDNRTP